METAVNLDLMYQQVNRLRQLLAVDTAVLFLRQESQTASPVSTWPGGLAIPFLLRRHIAGMRKPCAIPGRHVKTKGQIVLLGMGFDVGKERGSGSTCTADAEGIGNVKHPQDGGRVFDKTRSGLLMSICTRPTPKNTLAEGDDVETNENASHTP